MFWILISLRINLLLQIAHVLMFGKATLWNKKHGGPKGRGEHMGAQTVTEGLIASTATIVSFALFSNLLYSAV
jgi:hypothetical protein